MNMLIIYILQRSKDIYWDVWFAGKIIFPVFVIFSNLNTLDYAYKKKNV